MHPAIAMFYGFLMCVCLCGNVLALDSEVVVLRAVRGRDALLPCGQGKVFLDGPDSYVLWLKNDNEILYRFPNEESLMQNKSRDRVFGTSCDPWACYDDTSLLVKKVGEQDRGIYRCRVHYQASPSLDYVIEVRLVGSPGHPRIFNVAGEEIRRGYVGPLSLGSDLKLICEIDDDEQDTLLYWRRNSVTIERTHSVSFGMLRAEVDVRNLSRDELDAHYECLAQNADVTEPLSASVVVKMYLPPLSVEIRLNNNLDFETGQPRVVDCVVVGCVPPPAITWHLGDVLLRPSVHKELHDGNYTVSSLTLAPSLTDSKHDLICRAHNSHLPKSVFEDKVTLNVGYRPICLTTREEIIGAVLHEAETVTCEVEASPDPIQFIWTFADSRTVYGIFKKVPGYHNRFASTLTWQPRDSDEGVLLCRATNTFGEQKRPCSYTIVPGGPPHAPDCEVLRSSPNDVRVQCHKGWDGGRSQVIHLELLNTEGKVLQNVSNTVGDFNLYDVESDKKLTARVYASSSRGRSKTKTTHLQLTITPLNDSVTETEDKPGPSWTQWLEVIGGAVAVSAAIVVIAVCVKLLKTKRSNLESTPDLVLRPDGIFHREPDVAKEERATTTIMLNQLEGGRNQYSASPVPSCRVIVGRGSNSPSQDCCPASGRTYYI